jgi:hypothetical protein
LSSAMSMKQRLARLEGRLCVPQGLPPLPDDLVEMLAQPAVQAELEALDPWPRHLADMRPGQTDMLAKLTTKLLKQRFPA